MLAKIIISPIETRVGEIEKFLELPKNHPDLLYFEAGEKLGIEQARIIKDHLAFKPHSAEGRVVVLEEAGKLTDESQNALLKTLEELPEKAIFLLGISNENELLPTVLSRCEIIVIPTVIPSNDGIQLTNRDIKQLQNSTLEEKFEYVEKLKDKKEFLNELIKFYRQELIKNPSKENQDFIKELMEAEKWMSSNGNQRAIIEYLMIMMPSLDT